MNIINQNRIQHLIENGFSFDIGASISEGFEIVKKELVLFVVFTLIAGIMILVVSSFLSAFQHATEGSVFTEIVFQFFSQFTSQLIIPPLMAGYFIAAHKVHQREVLDFGDFFKGFDYYGQLLIQSLIIAGINFLLYIPLILVIYSMDLNNINTTTPSLETTQIIIFVLVLLVIILISMYVYTIYLFASSFVIFGDMQAWEAMETSREIVNQNLWIVFGFLFILILIFIGGMLLCCVGLLIALPVFYASIYVVFRDLMGFDDSNIAGEEDLLNHLVD